MTITDPEFYTKPFKSDVKRFLMDRTGVKDWDAQIYAFHRKSSGSTASSVTVASARPVSRRAQAGGAGELAEEEGFEPPSELPR
jgi:hypothetical protein